MTLVFAFRVWRVQTELRIAPSENRDRGLLRDVCRAPSNEAQNESVKMKMMEFRRPSTMNAPIICSAPGVEMFWCRGWVQRTCFVTLSGLTDGQTNLRRRSVRRKGGTQAKTSVLNAVVLRQPF